MRNRRVALLVPIRNEESILDENGEEEEDDALDGEGEKISSDDIELKGRQGLVTVD